MGDMESTWLALISALVGAHYFGDNARMSSTEIFESARKLRPDERLKLLDALLETLDEPDPIIEAAWAAEAPDRLAAYERGELPLADVGPLLARYR